MPDEPPKLTIASSKTQEELELAHGLEFIDTLVRNLAGNIIRVIRGAGEPTRLFDQILSIHNAIGQLPAGTTVGTVNGAIVQALDGGLGTEEGEFEDAVRAIERGALRTVAARLMDQSAQVAAGDHDLWEGVYRLERAREASSRRAERQGRKVKPRTRR